MKSKNKVFIVLMLLILIVAFSTACSKNNSEQLNQETNNQIVFTDDLGNEVKVEKNPSNVVCLMGSYADTWISAGGNLVGVTDDVTDYRDIVIKEDTKTIGTVKDPNLEVILSLKPDFVILSADISSHLDVAKTLKQNNINHAFFKVEVFDDYLNMLKIFTDITEKPHLYTTNGLNVKDRIEKIKSHIKVDKEPSVLLIRAFSKGAKAKTDDIMAGAMLKELGASNIASKYPSLLEDLSMELIIKEDPEYIFVITMGQDTEKALEGLKNSIQNTPAWANLSAVKNDRYIVLPKELFHYKPNSRWDEAYEYLAKILYEKQFK